MPSTYTASLRIEMQAAGENLNTWGAPRLNNALKRIDFSIAGLSTIALTGNYTLTSSNVADDQARSAFLKFTGTGSFVVTIPSVSKGYAVWNACTGALTITTGVGAIAEIQPGELCQVFCDGSGVYKVKPLSYDQGVLRGLPSPTEPDQAAPKSYVDGMAFAASDLPGQGPGTVGATIFSNGTLASWRVPTYEDIVGAAPADSPSFTGVVKHTGATKENVAAVTAEDLDLSSASLFVKSISANTTFTFSNLPVGDEDGMAFAVRLTISSGAVPSWPPEVKWSGGTKPPLPNGTHLIGFLSFDDGNTWNAVLGGVSFG